MIIITGVPVTLNEYKYLLLQLLLSDMYLWVDEEWDHKREYLGLDF